MIINIDPGAKKAGAAVYDPSGLFTSAWLVRGNNWVETADNVIEGLPVSARRISVVVIEKMQHYEENPVPVEDLLTLSKMAARVTGLFPQAKVVEYLPRTWKKQVPKNIMIERIKAKLTDAERKRVRLPRLKDGHKDVWDAVGIGQYHLRKERRG